MQVRNRPRDECRRARSSSTSSSRRSANCRPRVQSRRLRPPARLEALIASIDRFDPAKGATLEQFARTRITRRGARRTPLPGLGAALAAAGSATSPAGADLDLPARSTAAARPTRSWPTRSRGVTVEDLRRREHDIANIGVTSLNRSRGLRRRDHVGAHRHAVCRHRDRRRPGALRDVHRGQAQVPPRVCDAAQARARSRRAALRQEPSRCARSRRRRLREPRLPDPFAASRHAEGAAPRGMRCCSRRSAERSPPEAFQVLQRECRSSRTIWICGSVISTSAVPRLQRQASRPAEPPTRPRSRRRATTRP